MPNRIFILGDVHQDFKPIRSLCSLTRPDETDTLILLGDVGANFFFNYQDRNFKEKLGKYNFTYFCIRGNHEQRPSIMAEENPDEWTREEYFDNDVWVEKKYPYIKYAMDYPCSYNIGGKWVMCFPGAYSVDKWHRLENHWTWFPQEQLTEEEMNTGRMMVHLMKKCDLVLSHTCPIIYEPTDLFINGLDQSTVDKTMERYLGEIENNLDYKLWCFAHYHHLRVYPKYEDRQMLMLFNQAVLDLNKYFETKDIYNSLIDIQEA